jgi:hypothetical protein
MVESGELIAVSGIRDELADSAYGWSFGVRKLHVELANSQGKPTAALNSQLSTAFWWFHARKFTFTAKVAPPTGF